MESLCRPLNKFNLIYYWPTDINRLWKISFPMFMDCTRVFHRTVINFGRRGLINIEYFNCVPTCSSDAELQRWM